MAHIAFRLSATWRETLLHRLDLVLERAERSIRSALMDQDFRSEIQAARIRRVAAHGCGGQALI